MASGVRGLLAPPAPPPPPASLLLVVRTKPLVRTTGRSSRGSSDVDTEMGSSATGRRMPIATRLRVRAPLLMATPGGAAAAAAAAAVAAATVAAAAAAAVAVVVGLAPSGGSAAAPGLVGELVAVERGVRWRADPSDSARRRYTSSSPPALASPTLPPAMVPTTLPAAPPPAPIPFLILASPSRHARCSRFLPCATMLKLVPLPVPRAWVATRDRYAAATSRAVPCTPSRAVMTRLVTTCRSLASLSLSLSLSSPRVPGARRRNRVGSVSRLLTAPPPAPPPLMPLRAVSATGTVVAAAGAAPPASMGRGLDTPATPADPDDSPSRVPGADSMAAALPERTMTMGDCCGVAPPIITDPPFDAPLAPAGAGATTLLPDRVKPPGGGPGTGR